MAEMGRRLKAWLSMEERAGQISSLKFGLIRTTSSQPYNQNDRRTHDARALWKPFKDELRKEIAELKRDFWNERKEHMTTRRALRYSKARIEELEAQIGRIRQQAQNVLQEVDRDIAPAIVDRVMNRKTG